MERHKHHHHHARVSASPIPAISVTSLDIVCDASKFITGGTNPELSVYDKNTDERVLTLGLTPDRTGQVAESSLNSCANRSSGGRAP